VLGQAMLESGLLVPEYSPDQVEPPVVVARMVPEAPTAQHVVVLPHPTPYRVFEVPEVWLDHVEPPFDVPTRVPDSPTAKHVVELGQRTP
jgi:hypothetical protein